MRGVKNNSIYVPSTFRMLRLLNAKVCERGEECCSFNLLEETTGSLLLPECARPFGLAICDPCMQELSVSVGNWQSWHRQNSRIHTHENRKVLRTSQIDQATGETTGSIVLFKEVKQIENTYRQFDKCNEILNERLAKRDKEICEKDQDRRRVFVAAFDEAMNRYDAHVQAKRDVIIAKQNAKDTERASRKLELAKPVFEKISCALEGYKYRELALECQWIESIGYCNFSNWPSKAAFGSLMSAPSSATQKKITDCVSVAQDLYNLLETEGFLGDDSFCKLKQSLHTPGVSDSDKGLIRFFLSPENSKIALKGWDATRLLNLLLHGTTAEFIFLILKPAGWYHDIPESEFVRKAFIYGVLDLRVASDRDSKKRKLATEAWNRKNKSAIRVGCCMLPLFYEQFIQSFGRAKAEFARLCRTIRQYQNDPDTISWLAEKTEPVYAGQTFTRQVSLLSKSISIGGLYTPALII